MKKSALFGLLAICLFCSGFQGCTQKFDLIIKSGEIYDGSGKDPVLADVGIVGDRIVAIGKLSSNAPKVIQASGLYVAPGFIDVHNHADFRNKDRRSVENFLTQGVTTLVTGNCGYGEYKVAELFSRVEENGVGPNVMQLVGHNTIRQLAMKGSFDRDPTPEEMEKMKEMVRIAMEGGAAGISTGLYYPPGSYAKTEEVIELAKVVREYNGIYSTHIRDEGDFIYEDENKDGLLDAIREAITIGREADITVDISHIKAEGILGEDHWGKSKEVLKIIEQAQAEGQNIYADQYPYTASSTDLASVIIPRWVQADGKMKEHLSDPALSKRIKKEVGRIVEGGLGPHVIVISRFHKKKEWEGKNIKEIAEMWEKSPTEAAIGLVLMGNPDVVVHSMSPDDVERYMREPYIMTSSDGANIKFGVGMPHPRNYGSFPRKIRKYVLEKQILTMPEAIRVATSLPAELMGLEDRGWIKEGFIADIVVFNPKSLTDKATFSDPHQYSVGIEYLVINGKLVIEQGAYNGELAGKPIRKTHSQ
jgi:N-acyl-D-aspartate/D-glutamate deacylase